MWFDVLKVYFVCWIEKLFWEGESYGRVEMSLEVF